MVVLEERESALERGAPILAEILGYGESCDATHMSSPQAEGMKSAMLRCLADAGLPPDAIDYVCAHATGTEQGDGVEAAATFALFGDRIPVSSLKGHFGHMLAACGTIELICSILAIQQSVVPPTLNLQNPDVAPLWLPTVPHPQVLRRVMSNNFAFGGINTSLLVAAPD